MIRQLDVVPNPEQRSRDRIPYVIVLQSDRFDGTRGVVVAPLVPAGDRMSDFRLYPIVEVEGLRLAIVVSELATAPRHLMRQPIASLAQERHRIVAALDLLFTGI